MTNTYFELNDLSEEIVENNEKHGFYADDRTFGDKMMLAVSELSEALDEFRDGRALGEIYFVVKGQPITEVSGYTWQIGQELPLPVYLRLINDFPNVVEFLKPEGIPIELVDCLIRVLDDLHHMCKVDVAMAMYIKMAYNKTRPYKHNRVHL